MRRGCRNESLHESIFCQPLRPSEKTINKEIIVHVLSVHTVELRSEGICLFLYLWGLRKYEISVILNNFLKVIISNKRLKSSGTDKRLKLKTFVLFTILEATSPGRTDGRSLRSTAKNETNRSRIKKREGKYLHSLKFLLKASPTMFQIKRPPSKAFEIPLKEKHERKSITFPSG